MNIFKKEVLFSALILVFGVSLISNQAFAQEKDKKEEGKLYGKVVDSSSDKALAEIKVTLQNADQKAKTDKKGMYVFESLEAGTYTVVVKADGYQDWQKEVKVTAKGTMVEIELKPTESS
jgi:hypothetical protein